MRISITGASGFLGKYVSKKLLSEGHRVISWTRDRFQSKDLDIRFYDLRQAEAINLYDTDVLIHSAAYIPDSYEDFSVSTRCLMDNGLATLQLLQAANKAEVKTFIYLSSGQIYAWGNEAKEMDPIDPVHRASPYLISKMVGDCYVRSFKTKMRVVVLRPSSIYGPGMKQTGLLHKLINKIKASEIPVVNNYNIDLVHVEDVADMTVSAALDKKIFGVYNVGGGEAISTHNLIQYIYEALGNSCSDTQPSMLENGHAVLNIDKAKKIGYNPRRLKDGLYPYIASL